MNRRERREADRRAKKYGTPPISQSPLERDYTEFLVSHGIPADGLGTDILQLTDKLAKFCADFCESHDYDAIKQDERLDTWNKVILNSGFLPKEFRTQTKKVCMVCERRDCLNVRDETKRLKRCSHCLQVVYCSRACQNSDWPRHRSFCEAADIRKIKKDMFGRLLRSLRVHSFIARELLIYTGHMLRTCKKPEGERMAWMFDFGVSLVPDPVHKPGRAPNAYMPQISSVQKRAIYSPLPVTDEFPSRTESFSTTYMDIDGVSAPHLEVRWDLEKMVEGNVQQPVILLGMINLFIRMDIDNALRLRIPRSVLVLPLQLDYYRREPPVDMQAGRWFLNVLHTYGQEGVDMLLDPGQAGRNPEEVEDEASEE